jgi:hypothetical protein
MIFINPFFVFISHETIFINPFFVFISHETIFIQLFFAFISREIFFISWEISGCFLILPDSRDKNSSWPGFCRTPLTNTFVILLFCHSVILPPSCLAYWYPNTGLLPKTRCIWWLPFDKMTWKER